MKKLISLILIFLLGCARGPGRSPGEAQVHHPGFSWSERREVEIGRQIHQTIVSSFRIYTEPRLVGYVSRIGRSVARHAERSELTYQFTVLYDDRVYATQAPGGFVYVTTGFLNFIQNEAELASVLTQEVALLQFRDPRLSFPRRALGAVAQTGAIAAPFFGQFGALAAAGLVLLHAFAESLIPSAEDRLRGADEKALRYLVAARQDPQGYLDLASRLLNTGPDWAPYLYDYSLSHPMSIKRHRQIVEEFEELRLEGKSFDVRRDRYLELTRGVRAIYQK